MHCSRRCTVPVRCANVSNCVFVSYIGITTRSTRMKEKKMGHHWDPCVSYARATIHHTHHKAVIRQMSNGNELSERNGISKHYNHHCMSQFLRLLRHDYLFNMFCFVSPS